MKELLIMFTVAALLAGWLMAMQDMLADKERTAFQPLNSGEWK